MHFNARFHWSRTAKQRRLRHQASIICIASRWTSLDYDNALRFTGRFLCRGIALATICGQAVAGSPFATGASAMQGQLVSILTPLAAVAVMVSGVMAWFGRISWWWMVGVVLGTVLVFGGPQIVSWIRSMFGV